MMSRDEIVAAIVKEEAITRDCFFDFVEQMSAQRPAPEGGLSVEDLNRAYTAALEAVADYQQARAH